MCHSAGGVPIEHTLAFGNGAPQKIGFGFSPGEKFVSSPVPTN